MTGKICPCCGQVIGIEEYDHELWDLYHRIRDGRAYREALVFDGRHFDEYFVTDDDYDRDAMNLAMERDMHSRGLCTECGRPNMAGVEDEDIMSEDEVDELAEMYAEQAAERRAGC